MISQTSPVYDKKLQPYTFNLDEGEAALRRRPASSPGTTFTFWALAGRRDEWITMAQILQQDLQKIGLNLTIDPGAT